MVDAPGRHAEPGVVDRPADPDAGSRGSLEIADRAVATIVRRSIVDVPGVAPTSASGTMNRAVGRGYPRVSVQRAGQHVRVGVDLAVLWPAPAGTIAGRVQEAIAHGLAELAGLVVDGVDVTVRTVQRAEVASEGRVR
ncbi:Asp23/Gls24 family envelope stress response protein [Actinotalea sp.]|uniref:Asp23/Gls24 family envelope stress response protein n=1 Tax=Actinotalea sp. TaxID=1872145 RepID=UPI0035687111